MAVVEMESRDARAAWRDLLDQAVGGDDVVITRYGKPAAVLIDYELWQRFADVLEDLRLAELAHNAYLEDRKSPNNRLTLSQLREELQSEGLLDG